MTDAAELIVKPLKVWLVLSNVLGVIAKMPPPNTSVEAGLMMFVGGERAVRLVKVRPRCPR